MNGDAKAIDVLIVGGGPAGLAAALRLQQKLNAAGRRESVVVVEKAPHPGYHNLSGAVFEADCLDDLVRDWRDDPTCPVNAAPLIERDEMYFLGASRTMRIPAFAVPPRMRHKGDRAISSGKLVEWLSRLAERAGVEIHHGFAAGRLVLERGTVRGVKLVDLGLGPGGEERSNYLPGETLEAKVTIISDGSRGVLSGQLTEILGPGHLPQVYSIGVKEIHKLPKDNDFGSDRAIHTLGFPLKRDVFGGGFIYSMGEDTVAVGLILGLDWRYRDVSPQLELEAFKRQPFVAGLLEGGEVIAAGAKTIPEGGYFSVPPLCADGALLVGDAAGFVNMEKMKGIHYAIRSGMCAGEAVFEAIKADDFSSEGLAGYEVALEEGVLNELFHARNFRQAFQHGLLWGAPLSLFQSLMPFKASMEEDYRGLRSEARLDRSVEGAADRADFVSLSGAIHREDEPPHVQILNPGLCKECSDEYSNPCLWFCPGMVYRKGSEEIVVSASNCMHCGTCAVKCPYQNVRWTPPEGGEGPRFKQM
jgi:electron-transferring-flavoprotein dehydrogenase